MNRNYVGHFPRFRKNKKKSEELNIWAWGSVTESTHNWIMRIEILSNPWAFVDFDDLIIEVIKDAFRDLVLFAHFRKRETLVEEFYF